MQFPRPPRLELPFQLSLLLLPLLFEGADAEELGGGLVAGGGDGGEEGEEGGGEVGVLVEEGWDWEAGGGEGGVRGGGVVDEGLEEGGRGEEAFEILFPGGCMGRLVEVVRTIAMGSNGDVRFIQQNLRHPSFFRQRHLSLVMLTSQLCSALVAALSFGVLRT